jgi:polyhydroxybutyrate depolymerase
MNRGFVLWLAFALAAPCACKFNPTIDANGFVCGSADDCPSGYACTKAPGATNGVCCSNKDTAACHGAGGSSGQPAAGGTPADAALPPLAGGSGGGAGSPGSGGTVSQGGTGGQGGTGVGGATMSTTVAGSAGIQATGGTPTTAGATAGSSIAGGASATGGRTAIAGTSGAGGRTVRAGTTAVGGTVAGGNVATGGTTTSTSKASPGCGLAKTSSTLTYTIENRSYVVLLPTNYESNMPHPVVFQYHTKGGSAQQAQAMFAGIKTNFPEAIYVLPQGLDDTTGPANWSNTDGQDIAFTKLVLADLQSKYCVDNNRVFAVGLNAGAMMCYTIACQLGSLFRAVAPIGGSLFAGTSCAAGLPIAMFAVHGLTDTSITVENGRVARDAVLKVNHCTPTSSAVTPSPCVKYQGCAQGYDVTWCEWDGGTAIPSFANPAIADFFKQF